MKIEYEIKKNNKGMVMTKAEYIYDELFYWSN